MARNSKNKPPKQTPADSQSEFLEEIQRLRKKGIEYLKEEIKIFTASPGQHQEVIRVLKALRDLEREYEAAKPRDPGPAGPSREQFGFDFLEDPEG